MPVYARGDGIILRPQLHPRHVLDSHRGTIRIGAHDDVAEFFRRGQAAFCDDNRIQLLAGRCRQLPKFAGSELRILGSHGLGDIAGCQVIGMELLGLQPQPHRIFGAEQYRLAHARHAADILQQVGCGVAAESHIVAALVRRNQRDEHQVITRRLRHGYAHTTYIIRQTCFGALDAVLCFDRSDIKIGARLES